MAAQVATIESKIVSDINLVKSVYTIVQKAGTMSMNEIEKEATTNKDGVKKYSVCVSDIGIDIRDPSEYECTKKKIPTTKFTYDSSDITIVGGVALNLYDYLFNPSKGRIELEPLINYIKKETSDIDIVWWPRTSYTEKIINSKSEVIGDLVKKFKEKIISEFNNDDSKEFRDLIKKLIIEHSKNGIVDETGRIIIVDKTDDVIIGAKAKHSPLPGVYSIKISCTIGVLSFKLCDISVHDTGSSQKYKLDGTVPKLEFMDQDPIFSTNAPGYLNHKPIMIEVDKASPVIIVPNIKSFVNQQMLAFNNFIISRDEDKLKKALINYKRVQFIKLLFEKMKIFFEKMKIIYPYVNYIKKYDQDVNYIIKYIDTLTTESIKQYSDNILELCKDRNTTNELVNKLCNLPIFAEKSYMKRFPPAKASASTASSSQPPLSPRPPLGSTPLPREYINYGTRFHGNAQQRSPPVSYVPQGSIPVPLQSLLTSTASTSQPPLPPSSTPVQYYHPPLTPRPPRSSTRGNDSRFYSGVKPYTRGGRTYRKKKTKRYSRKNGKSTKKST